MRTPKIIIALTALAIAHLAACVAEESPDKTDIDPVTTEDEYLEAIPNEHVLGLTLGEEGQASQALTPEEEAGPRSNLREHTVEVLNSINELRMNTHETIEAIVANSEAQAVYTEGNKTCKVWVTDGANNRWQLASCRVDARAKRYAFALRGKPLASDSDDDYLPVFAGEGVVLPRYERRRRGAGIVGYDFDNIATLTGDAVQGKLVVGYRAKGPARQLNIGLAEIAGDDDQPYSALYRFNHLVGRGGSFHYLTKHDFLTRDADGHVTEGNDGIDELGRAAVAWTVTGAGRTAHAVCGGTLGEGACFRVHQCWTASGTLTWEEILDNDGDPNWERTSCADVPFDVNEPLDEDAFELPADESGEPAVDEPTEAI